MWPVLDEPTRLCLLALSVLAACSVDLSKLRGPLHRDAAQDLVLPSGGTGGGTADAEGSLDERRSADLPTIGPQDAQAAKASMAHQRLGSTPRRTKLASGGRGGAVDGAGGGGGGDAMGGVDGAGGIAGLDVETDQTASTDDGGAESTAGADGGGAMGGADGAGALQAWTWAEQTSR